MTQRNRYVSYAVWSSKQAAFKMDRKNMAVLIVEGRIHQFVTTDSWVRLCYVTSLATALSIPIIFCFNHAKCFNLSKHRWRCSTRRICDSTASCPFNQYDCVIQDRGSTDRLSTYNKSDVAESLGEDY